MKNIREKTASIFDALTKAMVSVNPKPKTKEQKEKMISTILQEFLIKKLGNITKPLTRNLMIEDAFGMAGLDSLTFYDDFITEFEIKIPENFDIYNYTTPSPDLILPRKKRKQIRYTDVTLGELDDMITTKIWLKRVSLK